MACALCFRRSSNVAPCTIPKSSWLAVVAALPIAAVGFAGDTVRAGLAFASTASLQRRAQRVVISALRAAYSYSHEYGAHSSSTIAMEIQKTLGSDIAISGLMKAGVPST